MFAWCTAPPWGAFTSTQAPEGRRLLRVPVTPSVRDTHSARGLCAPSVLRSRGVCVPMCNPPTVAALRRLGPVNSLRIW
jgi:hypothetical protein